jgi:hypothetical protein
MFDIAHKKHKMRICLWLPSAIPFGPKLVFDEDYSTEQNKESQMSDDETVKGKPA